MKRFAIIVAVMTMSLFTHAQTINDPNAEPRTVESFHGINVSNAFDVYLSQGNEEALAVSSSDKEYISSITTEVRNGILFIGVERSKWSRGNKKLKAYISFRKMDKINISGACDVFINNVLKGTDLKIDMSGASDMKGKIEVTNLDVDISGASDMTISGKATQFKIDASGASNFKGENFTVDYCTADASGASDVKITVNKELSANVSGASDLRYKGEGLIRDIRTSGAGSVKRI